MLQQNWNLTASRRKITPDRTIRQFYGHYASVFRESFAISISTKHNSSRYLLIVGWLSLKPIHPSLSPWPWLMSRYYLWSVSIWISLVLSIILRAEGKTSQVPGSRVNNMHFCWRPGPHPACMYTCTKYVCTYNCTAKNVRTLVWQFQVIY